VQCAMSCAAATGAGNSDTLEVEDEVHDASDSCDPAGAVFDETLVGLDDMGKHLIYFSSGTNLPAVRWLFEFGVPRDVRDKNGTTALHCACRSGSLAIVQELHRRGIQPSVTDLHGWTPLHIAIFMNRRDVVLYLLSVSAPIGEMDIRGRTPLDLCKDASTKEVIRKFMVSHGGTGGPGVPTGTGAAEDLDSMEWVFGLEDERGSGRAPDSLQYEPFFVPRDPLVADIDHKSELLMLGSRFFNQCPGKGLSFLVASGCARDYPNEMSTFLRRGTLDLAQIGNFLGEPFSISQTLRLELINSQRYTGMTLVDGLTKVFDLMYIPEDLQKVDRFIHSAARIWWRQHERIFEDQEGLLTETAAHRRLKKLEQNTDPGHGDAGAGDELEIDSVEVRGLLSGAEVLYQFMFSIVMLHRSFYENPTGNPTAEHRLSMSKWMELNSGIEEGGASIPTALLRAAYRAIDATFIPQLSFQRTSAHQKQVLLEKENTWGETLGEASGLCSKAAQIEGWVVVGEALKRAGFASAMWYGNVSTIFSETMAATPGLQGSDIAPRTSSRTAPGSFGQRKLPVTSIPALAHTNGQAVKAFSGKTKDQTWLSLVHSVLFFSASPSSSEVPYAFVYLAQMEISHDTDVGVVTIRRRQTSMSAPASDLAEEHNASNQKPGQKHKGVKGLEVNERPPVIVVFLLHDGRWQEFNMPRLELRIGDDEDCERWAAKLAETCKSLDEEATEIAEISHH